MDPDFWRGKRVFLTGHTGFKGSWLSLWLARHGAVVTGYALEPPTDPSLFELAGVADELHSIRADVRDAKRLSDALAEADPEIVFHLAAQPLVRESYAEPVETFETNVMGTVNLLQAMRASDRIKSAVIVTSDKCYHNREWHWGYREDEAMGGADPYSASKGCTELVTASFRRSFFSAPGSALIASGRAGNVIGGGDFARDRLITDIMAAIREGEPVRVRNPEAIRPWQHVLEPLHGYLLLAEALAQRGEAFACGWNFGPTDEDVRPVRWICDELTGRWGQGASWVTDGGDHPHEATYLKLDSSRARNLLGWRPKLRLHEALDWIIDWNKTADAQGDIRARTLQEIKTYESL